MYKSVVDDLVSRSLLVVHLDDDVLTLLVEHLKQTHEVNPADRRCVKHLQ